MPKSPHWSNTSAPFRLEWRPSRWVTGALLALAVLAPLAVLASEMPPAAAWPLAAIACVWGLVRARREWRRPPCVLDWPPSEGTTGQWRGPLLFVRGPGIRLSWWPDTLDAATRRELRRVMAP